MATPLRLILASASEGRRDLLRRAGYEFEVQPSHIEEPDSAEVTDPRAYVQHTAWLKAAAVASRVANCLILAADSVGWLDGQVILKPVDRADARRMLQRLAGSRHELWTGVCLWQRPGDWQISWQESSVVEMRPFSPAELESYLDTNIWEGKSGAYAIQDRDDPYVRVVAGSTSNVVGLPLESLARVLAWVRNSLGE